MRARLLPSFALIDSRVYEPKEGVYAVFAKLVYEPLSKSQRAAVPQKHWKDFSKVSLAVILYNTFVLQEL